MARASCGTLRSTPGLHGSGDAFFRTATVSMVAVFAVSACSVIGYMKTVPLGHAELYRGHELRLPLRTYGRGNVHDPFDYDRYEHVDADWFSLTQEGRISPEHDTVRECPVGYAPRFGARRTRVRGAATVSDDSVTIAFQVEGGMGDDGIRRWIDYSYNGTYPLTRPEHAPMEAQPDNPAECVPEGPAR